MPRASAACGYCHFCRAGDVFPGIFAPGGFAELIRTNARAIVPLRPGVTPVDVGPLGLRGMTAYGAVKKTQDRDHRGRPEQRPQRELTRST